MIHERKLREHSNELLLCPFCDGEPMFEERYYGPSGGVSIFLMVSCKSCGATSRGHNILLSNSYDLAAANWNKRCAPSNKTVER